MHVHTSVIRFLVTSLTFERGLLKEIIAMFGTGRVQPLAHSCTKLLF